MTTETRHADVLEFLDLNGGRCYVAALVRRGIANDLLAELERDGLVRRDDVRIELTDRGAAAMEGPVVDEAEHIEPNSNGTTRERILALLAEHPDGLRARAIHPLIGVSQGTAAPQLSALHRAGKIERRRIGEGTTKGTLYVLPAARADRDDRGAGRGRDRAAGADGGARREGAGG